VTLRPLPPPNARCSRTAYRQQNTCSVHETSRFNRPAPEAKAVGAVHADLPVGPELIGCHAKRVVWSVALQPGEHSPLTGKRANRALVFIDQLERTGDPHEFQWLQPGIPPPSCFRRSHSRPAARVVKLMRAGKAQGQYRGGLILADDATEKAQSRGFQTAAHLQANAHRSQLY
jgi:hypothetical protein